MCKSTQAKNEGRHQGTVDIESRMKVDEELAGDRGQEQVVAHN